MDPHAPAAAELFPHAEVERLHSEDMVAATRVVSLMVGIFCVGVVLYTIVAWACT
jgi:hypothetical protein